MDYNQIMQIILYTVIVTILPAVTASVIRLIQAKVEGTRLEEATTIILDVVKRTNQTYVDDLKKAGTFTEEAHKEALRRSLTAAVSLMNSNLQALIIKKFGSLEGWIITKIESQIKQSKSTALAIEGITETMVSD
ncbi:MAG TPA: hypothetical protein DIT32_03415 [Peptococcaceae bacterium]|nr:hypothetical protein [Peptococcaceae bacterium]